MLKRRLILLLVLALVAIGIVGARLAVLQIAQAKFWKQQARRFSYRHFVIPTTRGAIVDRNGVVLAVEEPCYNLEIEYQAMNRDDQWINRHAIALLRRRYPHNVRAIIAHLPAQRRKIAAELRSLPRVIAKICGVPERKVLHRFDLIRARMQLLRQDIWTLRYSHHNATEADESPTEVLNRIAQAGHLDLVEAHEAHTIVPDVSNAVAFYFKKHADRYPGLVIAAGTHRVYPLNSVAAQIIGTMRPAGPAAIEANPFVLPDLIPGTLTDTKGKLGGLLPGDLVGASGVELAADAQLRGRRGVKLLNLDGKVVRADTRPPRAGKTVRLTLDARLVQTLQRQLLAPTGNLLNFNGSMHNCALAVISIRTGNVLVMLSLPTYNANTYHRDFAKLAADNAFPLLNRAIDSPYPPGSIVKPIESTFATLDGVITPDSVINCGAYFFPGHPNVFRNWTYPVAPGPLRLTAAIEQSCDTYFYRVGMLLGLKRLVRGYQSFGLGSPTGVGLADETGGYLPRIVGDLTRPADRTNAIFMGIGQGPIAVTPLQMANAYAGMMRGGIWESPHLIDGLPRLPPHRIPMDASAMPAIEQGMYLVVHGHSGTAPVLNMHLPVAGKTGTAQTHEVVVENGHKTIVKGDDAWFAGYAPADAPRYAFAAVVEMGGDGGKRAGPIVRQCLLDMEQAGYLPHLDKP